MSHQNYYMNILAELLSDDLITLSQFDSIEQKVQKKLGYKWPSWRKSK